MDPGSWVYQLINDHLKSQVCRQWLELNNNIETRNVTERLKKKRKTYAICNIDSDYSSSSAALR